MKIIWVNLIIAMVIASACIYLNNLLAFTGWALLALRTYDKIQLLKTFQDATQSKDH